ncbi:hypothetical protein GCM10028807_53420 [Spirosoma daeguense]
MTEEDLKGLASQLGKPTGEMGITTGERMNISNGNMIQRTIDTLAVQPNENVLEIGPGNGNHIKPIVEIAGVKYTGSDISETMIQEAQRLNATSVVAGNATFAIADGISLDFAADSFDAIFTVNTLYFWQQPLSFAQEIYRVLRPGGRFCLAFAHQDFMINLPFTKYGFTLYTSAKAVELLQGAQFLVQDVVEETELVPFNSTGDRVERGIVIVVATKA